MSNYINSPNMNLPVPVVGVDPGPDYASNVNNSLSLVDSHDHSSGKGVAVGPAGLNINADLPLNTNNLTLVKTVRFSAQGSPLAGISPNLACLYVVTNDLYYNDGAGNQVRMTQGGSIPGSSGTITGLPSGTASAAYSSGQQTFIFQSATNTAASLDGRNVVLRNSGASSPGLTLTAPSLSGNYSLTLPSLPGVQSIMTLDGSGNITAPYTVDNITIDISSNTIEVKALGIGTAQIANGAVTKAKLTSVGQQVSTSCGNFTVGGAGLTAVTNLTITITTTGRPVIVGVMPDSSGIGGGTIGSYSVPGTASPLIYVYRAGSAIRTFGPSIYSVVPSEFTFPFILDAPAAGTYTYAIYCDAVNSGCTLYFTNLVLYAYEL